jgi:hypothetical protein
VVAPVNAPQRPSSQAVAQALHPSPVAQKGRVQIRLPRIAAWHIAAVAGFAAVIALCLAFVFRDRWAARPLAAAPGVAPTTSGAAPTNDAHPVAAALNTMNDALQRFNDPPANDNQPAAKQKPADGKPPANEPPANRPPGGKPAAIDDKPAGDKERGGDEQPAIDFPPGFDVPPEFDDLPGMDELRRLLPGGASRRRTPDGWQEVESPVVGTSGTVPFKRLVAPDGFLYGVEYDTIEWFGEKCLRGLTPVVSVDQRPLSGKKRVVARDGYAVGAVNVYSQKYVNAMQFVFMRKVGNDRLDPDDSYTSEWFGEPGPGQVTTLGGDGGRPIGFQVYEGLVVEALALLTEVERGARRENDAPASKPNQRPGRLWDTQFAGEARSHDRERLVQPRAYLYGIECEVGDSFFKKRGILRLIPVFRPDESAIGANRAVARRGYAVGAANVLLQESIQALQLVFMRIRDEGNLDPDDSYTSDWLGDRTGHVTLTGNGARVVGIQVRQGLIVNAMALVLASGKPTSFVGDEKGGGLKQLVDPRGAMMFGVDYRLGSFGEKCIAELSPVYRRDAPSKLEGRLVAREAYAVGAVNVVSRTYVNALQLVYMRIRPGKGLDPDESYTSDWVGYGGAPTSLSGDGVRIVGIVTEKEWDVVSALALVAEDEPR